MQISAGPGYDRQKLKPVVVNDEANPTLVDGDNFCGFVCVRAINYSGLNGLSNPSSDYFKGIYPP